MTPSDTLVLPPYSSAESWTAANWFETAGDAVFVLDLSGAILYANSTALRLLGCVFQDIHGHCLQDLVAASHAQRVEDALRRVASTGREVFEALFPPAGAEHDPYAAPLVLEVVASTFAPPASGLGAGLLCLGRDISSRKQLEARIGRLHALHASLFVLGPLDAQLKLFCDGVTSIFDLPFTGIWLRGWVESAEIPAPPWDFSRDWLGKSLFLVSSAGGSLPVDNPLREVSLHGTHLGRLACAEASDGPCDLIAAVGRGPALTWCEQHNAKGFCGFALNWANGQNAGVLVFFSNKPVAPEESTVFLSLAGLCSRILQLGRAQDSALHAKSEAEMANFAKSRFMASMSHEMRTPLNAVIGLTEMAFKADSPTRIREYLGAMRLASDSLRRIIDDVLDFSRIEAGVLEILPAPFQLLDIVESITDLYSEKFGKKGLECVVSLDFNCPRMLSGDHIRLKQILINLLDNAFKFTAKGKVSLDIVCVAETRERALYSWIIRDTGIGFPPEKAEELFTPFYQGRADISQKYGGTGLGLAISKRLVSLMSGEIHATSELGKGSVFTMTLGFDRQINTLEPALELPASCRGKKILILERPGRHAAMLEKLCGQIFGLIVDVEHSGLAGLKRLRRSARMDAPYEAVVFCHNAVELDGIGFLDALLTETDLSVPPVLVCMARNHEAMAKHIEAGAFDVLSTPVKPRRLAGALALALTGQRAAASVEDEPLPVSGSNALQGARILVVEDNDVNRMMAIDMLRYGKMTVDAAVDGVAALEILDAKYHAANSSADPTAVYDAVLMDIQMPRLNGYETTKAIRADSRFASLPVIAMTAFALPGDRETCLAAGMSDYLAKPLDFDLLFATLAKWVAPRGIVPPALAVSPQTKTPTDPTATLLDLPDAMKRLKGHVTLYRRMIEAFIVEMEHKRPDFRDALATGDRETAIRHAHTLKGTAGNISAMALKDAASTLLTALRLGEQDSRELEPLAVRLEERLNETLQAACARVEHIEAEAAALKEKRP